MPNTVILQDQAKRDAKAIPRYIFKQSGRDKSKAFHDTLVSFLRTLAASSQKGISIHQELADVQYLPLEKPYDSYNVYWITQDEKIHVTHIRHSSRQKPTFGQIVGNTLKK